MRHLGWGDITRLLDTRGRKQKRAGREREVHRVEDKERCILCGRLTGVLKNKPVAGREHYIEGAGQLCRECYRKMYAPSRRSDKVQLMAFSGLGGERWEP